MNKKLTAKTISLIVAIAVAATALIGGTVAWIMAQTAPVVNTFTYGDIDIKLEETDAKWNDEKDQFEKEFEMIPGSVLEKDPKVTVEADSEANWLFVKLEKKGGDVTVGGKTYTFDDFLTYEMADGWIQLTDAQGNDVEGVFYREVAEIAENGNPAAFAVIKDNKVTVNGEVTKEMFNALDADATNSKIPTLTVTAYAVQKENIANAQAAWAVVDPQFNNTQNP